MKITNGSGTPVRFEQTVQGRAYRRVDSAGVLGPVVLVTDENSAVRLEDGYITYPNQPDLYVEVDAEVLII